MKRNVFALFGAVAVLLAATAALTLSRVTSLGSGSGGREIASAHVAISRMNTFVGELARYPDY
jgi:hypothetical protein